MTTRPEKAVSPSAQPSRRARSASIVCGAALVMCQAWVLASAALIPVLLTSRPVVLELTNGSLLSVAAAGTFVRSGHANLAVALTAPLIIWLPVDAVSWWAGRRFGGGLAKWWTERNLSPASTVARCESIVDKFGVLAVIVGPLLPLPTVLIFAATGWRRMPLALFILLDAVGVTMRGSVALAVGYSYGNRAINIARDFSQYSAWVAGIIIVAVCIIILIRINRVMTRRVRDHRHGDTNVEDD